MKSFITRSILLCTLLLTLIGCGKKEDFGEYKYISYDDLMTSTSAEYSFSNKKVYIEGILKDFKMIEVDDIQYLVANIAEEDNKIWIVEIGQAGTCSDENLTEYIGSKVRCFGKFLNILENSPLLELTTDDEYCMQMCKGNKSICSAEKLAPSISYIDNWFDANAEDVIYKDIADISTGTRKPGAYRSDGMVKGTDDDSLFWLYQKDGELFVDSYVHYSDGKNCVIPITDFKDYKDGDAVRIYFVMDKRKQCKIMYFRKILLSWDLNLEDTTAQQVFEKTYNINEKETINYSVFYTKSSNSYQYNITATLEDYDKLNAATLWYILRFVDSGEFYFTASLINSKESVFAYRTGTMQDMGWTDKSGNVIDEPSWFNVDDVIDSITMATVEIVNTDKLFENDFGYK